MTDEARSASDRSTPAHTECIDSNDNKVRTAGINILLGANLFHRQECERGKIDEQRRDALLAVHNAQGQSFQFIVTLTRGEGGIHTQLEPTHGTLMAYQAAMNRELTGVTFISGEQDVRAALNDVIRKLEAAGYLVDESVKVLLMKSQTNAGQ